jgi:general stress protein YciG
MVTEYLSRIRAAAGRRGGQSTSRTHDHQFYVDAGTQGVRAKGIEPISEMRQRIEEETKKEKEVMNTGTKRSNKRIMARVLEPCR